MVRRALLVDPLPERLMLLAWSRGAFQFAQVPALDEIDGPLHLAGKEGQEMLTRGVRGDAAQQQALAERRHAGFPATERAPCDLRAYG